MVQIKKGTPNIWKYIRIATRFNCQLLILQCSDRIFFLKNCRHDSHPFQLGKPQCDSPYQNTPLLFLDWMCHILRFLHVSFIHNNTAQLIPLKWSDFNNMKIQECIPVGCVLLSSMVIFTGVGVSVRAMSARVVSTPEVSVQRGCLSRGCLSRWCV